jgi:hypothetical protein
MKEFIAKNPKLVGGILGMVLAGLLSLAGLKMADVCAVSEPVPAVEPAQPK